LKHLWAFYYFKWSERKTGPRRSNGGRGRDTLANSQRAEANVRIQISRENWNCPNAALCW